MDAWTRIAAPFDPAQSPRHRAPGLSPLVSRLVHPDADSGRRRIRQMLLQLPDERLRAGLGLSDADIAALRSGRREIAARVPAAAVAAAGPRVPAAPRRPWHDTRSAIAGA